MKRSPDERQNKLKQNMEVSLVRFDSYGGFCQSEDMYVNTQ
jgi:hypothetical protein